MKNVYIAKSCINFVALDLHTVKYLNSLNIPSVVSIDYVAVYLGL